MLPQTFRYQQTLDALIKYAVSANEARQVELVPRILSYLKHLPAYHWDDLILSKGLYLFCQAWPILGTQVLTFFFVCYST